MMKGHEWVDGVFKHFGLDIMQMRDERKEFDFLIYEKEKVEKVTGNMSGFGLERSQRIIIDYDKDYDSFLVRREKVKYGTPEDVPYRISNNEVLAPKDTPQ